LIAEAVAQAASCADLLHNQVVDSDVVEQQSAAIDSADSGVPALCRLKTTPRGANAYCEYK
jgi:hypothetical protein